MARYIFVTGGVVSSLGKGLSSASLAYLLQSRGYKVRLRKLDPYLNVDPGTMSPFQHGEVYVTDDGAETDLDLGHYERFSGVSAKKSDNITTGKIYNDVLKKERKGEYLGKTVQVIPHITDRIKQFIKNDSSKEDFVICEIGGIVGDIESLPFVEAIRQFANDVGKKNALFFPSGSMANQAAIKLHTQPGEQLICDKWAHVFNYEGGGVSFNSGVSPNKANIGRMLARYICDTLLGHPFAQAFLANEKDIIDTVRNSNLHKQITFSSYDNVFLCLKVINEILSKSTFNKSRMKELIENSNATATDLANWLVQNLRYSFRDAYNVTGKIVSYCSKQNINIDSLSLGELKKYDKNITADAKKVLSATNSVKSKSSFGGTAPEITKKMMKLAIKKYL